MELYKIKGAIRWFSSWAKMGLTAEEMYDERDKLPRNEEVLTDAVHELMVARNALGDIPPSALKAGVVGEMVELLKELDTWDRERNTFLGEPFRKIIGTVNVILAKLKENR